MIVRGLSLEILPKTFVLPKEYVAFVEAFSTAADKEEERGQATTGAKGVETEGSAGRSRSAFYGLQVSDWDWRSRLCQGRLERGSNMLSPCCARWCERGPGAWPTKQQPLDHEARRPESWP